MNVFAFLEYDMPAFDGDPDYRPVLRQMDAPISRNSDGVIVDVENPIEGERLLVFLQVERKDKAKFGAKECFLKDVIEAHK